MSCEKCLESKEAKLVELAYGVHAYLCIPCLESFCDENLAACFRHSRVRRALSGKPVPDWPLLVDMPVEELERRAEELRTIAKLWLADQCAPTPTLPRRLPSAQDRDAP